MAIKATCTCGATFRAKDKLAGKRVKCPRCGAVIAIPAADSTNGDALDDAAFFAADTDLGAFLGGDAPLGDGFPPSTETPELDAPTDFSLGEGTLGVAPPTASRTCPNCRDPLSPEAIICTACGYHAGLGRRLEKFADANRDPTPVLPKNIQVEDTPESLTLTVRYATPPGIMAIITVVPGCILGFCWLAAFVIRGFILLLGLLALPAVLGPAAYALAVIWINRTVIHVDAAELSVRSTPLPWWIFRSRIPIDDIVQFYTVERRERRGRARHRGLVSAALDAHQVGTQGWYRLHYDLNIILKSGWRRRLLTVEDPKSARFLERKIERYLRVRNVEVVSTWYQRWLLRETTRGDEREVDSESALRAKSIPVKPILLVIPCCFALLMFGVYLFGSLNGSRTRRATVSVTNPANGHMYRVIKGRDGKSGLSWTEAEAKAVALGGQLVTVNDDAENRWIAATFRDAQYLWIGLHEIETKTTGGEAAAKRTFAWSSGQPVEFTNWQQGKPENAAEDEGYVVMYAFAQGGWDNHKDLANGSQGYPIYALAEIEKPPG